MLMVFVSSSSPTSSCIYFKILLFINFWVDFLKYYCTTVMQDFDPIRHILEHIPSEENDAGYFEKQVFLLLMENFQYFKDFNIFICLMDGRNDVYVLIRDAYIYSFLHVLHIQASVKLLNLASHVKKHCWFYVQSLLPD